MQPFILPYHVSSITILQIIISSLNNPNYRKATWGKIIDYSFQLKGMITGFTLKKACEEMSLWVGQQGREEFLLYVFFLISCQIIFIK